MDKFAIEAFLYSADFGEDSYLLASSSSSDSEPECCCQNDGSDDSTEKLRLKRPRVEGFAETTVPQMTDAEFKSHFRVSRITCEKITELIRNDFHSSHKGGWERITPMKAAYILLWYLGNQETFKQISDRFKITQSCIHHIVKVGCRNLTTKLNEYIKWPDPERYEEESLSFYEMSKISGIIGAVGVSHIKILKPRDDDKMYLNAKNYHSIAIQGIVGSDCKFFDLYVCEGSLEPVEILNKSSILPKVQSEDFEECFLVGNCSYPSLSWLVTPFQDAGTLTAKQKEFNQHHSYAYGAINNAFGLLKERFQKLNHLENKDVPFIMHCVQAACVIHNICIDLDDFCELFAPDEGIFEYEAEEEEDLCDDGRKTEVFSTFLEGCESDEA